MFVSRLRLSASRSLLLPSRHFTRTATGVTQVATGGTRSDDFAKIAANTSTTALAVAAMLGTMIGTSSVVYATSSPPLVTPPTPPPTAPTELNSDGLSIDSDDDAHLVNWSRTHEAHPQRLYLPENMEELEALVQYAHKTGRKLRPCGTFLSPNGIAGGQDMMVSLAGLDRIKNINLEEQLVTVEAGIVVDQLLKELSKLGLTLANFSSGTE